MKKTYVTFMPNHIGAFLKASKCFSELGINITRVSYNKAVDSHTLFIEQSEYNQYAPILMTYVDTEPTLRIAEKSNYAKTGCG